VIGGAPIAEIPFGPTSDGGDFEITHGLGFTPKLALPQIVGDNGSKVWFRGLKYDGTKIYLTAAGAGISGYIQIFDTPPGVEIVIPATTAGPFKIAHKLGAKPAMLAIQQTSGGDIWSDPDKGEADATYIYLVAGGDGLTGSIIGWLPTQSALGPLSTPFKQLDFDETFAPGDPTTFQVAHNLGAGIVPRAVFPRMTAGGGVWFPGSPGVRYDDTYIYGIASGSGVTGHFEIFV
jgi:hypothetical protein